MNYIYYDYVDAKLYQNFAKYSFKIHAKSALQLLKKKV